MGNDYALEIVGVGDLWIILYLQE